MPKSPALKAGDVGVQTVLARGRFLELIEENGWEYVRRHNSTGVVVILATTNEGELILVEQPRRPIHGYSIELPAGLSGDTAGSENESLQVAAERELEEETGFRASRWTKLLEAPSTAGLSSETITIFRATGLERVGEGGGDASEDITVHVIPVAEVPRFLAEKLAAGVAVDPKVFAALYLLDSDWPPSTAVAS